jgi:hypothetical protein
MNLKETVNKYYKEIVEKYFSGPPVEKYYLGPSGQSNMEARVINWHDPKVKELSKASEATSNIIKELEKKRPVPEEERMGILRSIQTLMEKELWDKLEDYRVYTDEHIATINWKNPKNDTLYRPR